MKTWLTLVAGICCLALLAVSCGNDAIWSAVITLAAVPPSPTIQSTSSETASPVPTLTLTPTLTSTATPLPPTPTETFTHTPTPWLPLYFFPIQPAEVASYVRGHHDYPAADIWAPKGSAFVAVTSGTLDYISAEDRWDPVLNDPATRGGISVALIGRDGVRYYGSHLSGLAPGIEAGIWVEAGQTLGFVGNSGNARSVAPHLHFGISHPTTPDDWEIRRGEIDPYPYLQAWQAGEMLTPEFKPSP